MTEQGEVQKPTLTDIATGIVRKSRVESGNEIHTSMNTVIGELDRVIDADPDNENAYISAVCDPLVLMELKISPADLVSATVRQRFSQGVMEKTMHIKQVFDDARAIGKTVAATITDDYAALSGSLDSIKDSHPGIDRVPLRAWADALARRRFPPPEGNFDKDKYKAIIKRETEALISSYNQADRRKKALDDAARTKQWEAIDLRQAPGIIENQGATLPEKPVEAEEPTQADRDAYNAYNTSTTPDFMDYLYSLDEDVMHHAIRYISKQIAHSQLPFTEASWKPPKDIQATPLIMRRFKTYLEAQQVHAATDINRWGEEAQQYRELTPPTVQVPEQKAA